MSSKASARLSPSLRALISLIFPFGGSVLFSAIAGGSAAGSANRLGEIALQLSGAGLTCLLLGQNWYGLQGLGLRGRRPLYAGIGFAVLPWLAFLVVRFFTVQVSAYGSEGTGRIFVHLLLFEGFCVQLWAFGFFFRGVADWRGPLTAAVGGGALFGLVAYLFFQESFLQQQTFLLTIRSLLYFSVWGVLYGIIRLRTGSILGMIIVQAMHGWTAWHLMAPPSPLPDAELGNLYLISTALYVLLIWRLWPKSVEDYRV